MSYSKGGKKAGGKQVNPLNRRIPDNPKYKHIRATVDTGASWSKYQEHIDEIRKNYRYRKDEIFKRLKVTTFAQLVLQVSTSEDADSVVFCSDPSPLSTPTHQAAVVGGAGYEAYGSPPGTARSTLSSVIAGVGEMDLSSEDGQSPLHAASPPPPPATCPYLLLDVRDREDYDRCHIITAMSYPASMLSRSCNYFTREILEYKNRPGRIIILYDEDERIAPKAATTFIQREVDNVFMMSGGLKVLYKVFPEGMITGSVPPSVLPSPPQSGRGRRKPPTPSYEHCTPGGYSGATPHHNKFTLEDLDIVRVKLDEVLSAKLDSRGSSRASSSSQLSSRSDFSRDGRSTRTDTSSAVPWR